MPNKGSRYCGDHENLSSPFIDDSGFLSNGEVSHIDNSWEICCRCVEISLAQGNFHDNRIFQKNKETNVFNQSLCSCNAPIENFDIELY